MKTQLLCTFTTTDDLNAILHYIKTSYRVSGNVVYVLENPEIPGSLYCTYNVLVENSTPTIIPASTISVHRKKQSNTLYTINALNQLIVQLNGGTLDNRYPIKWDDYRDAILVTAYGKLKILRTSLREIIVLEANDA